MNGAIHATPSGQGGIRRVGDRIRLHPRDVTDHQLQLLTRPGSPLHLFLLLLSSYMSYEPGDRPTILSRQFLVTFGIGLVVVLIVVAGIMYRQRGAHVELKGSILKVHTLGLDDSSSLAAIDFRFANNSDYPFVVRTVEVTAIGPDGQSISSSTVPDVEAKRIFEYYPVLGTKYNPSLITSEKIPGRSTLDRMIMARFELPLVQLDARKNLKIRIEDVDGPVSELVEK